MALPKNLNQDHKHVLEHHQRSQKLENILKNVVVRRLTEIRAIKSKPSLKDMIGEYLKKKADKDDRARVRIKE